ncbi:MAG: outer membrane beta-barrel protein [Chitinophagales bacterium]
MKNKLLLLSALLIAAGWLQAQNAYVQVMGGYSWPGVQKSSTILGFQPYFSDNLSEIKKVLDPAYAGLVPMSDLIRKGHYDVGGNFVDSFGKEKTIHDSYARGGNFTIGVGYKIRPWIAVQLGLTYVWGATISSNQEFDNLATLGEATKVGIKTYANGMSLMPSVVLMGAKSAESKYVPYVRLGMTLPVFGSTIHDIHIESPNAVGGSVSVVSDLQVKTESTVSLGFNGALGFEYRPMPLIGIFAEVNGTMLQVKAKESTLTKYTIDSKEKSTGKSYSANRITGDGELPTIFGILGADNKPLTNYSKVIEYVDQVSTSSNGEQFGKKRDAAHSGEAGYVDESKNHELKRVYANFNTIGINIGVNINMSKAIFEGMKKKK